MRWRDGYIAVDWGSTRRRAWRVDAAGPNASFEDDCGVLAMKAGDFPDHIANIRARLGDLPMMLGGMVGSNRGWRDVPYVECPAGTGAIASGILWVDDRTGIVPGLCQRSPSHWDVMRGEEVQIVGALALGCAADDGLLCLPGTHSKWVRLRGGEVEGFRSFMTGEMYALVRDRSVLSDLMGGRAKADAGFREGVAQGQGGAPLLSALFRVRARALLEGDVGDSSSRVSGLLIGSEIAAAIAEFNGSRATLIGQPELCALYAEALRQAGCAADSVDGGEAFLAGIATLVEAVA